MEHRRALNPLPDRFPLDGAAESPRLVEAVRQGKPLMF